MTLSEGQMINTKMDLQGDLNKAVQDFVDTHAVDEEWDIVSRRVKDILERSFALGVWTLKSADSIKTASTLKLKVGIDISLKDG
jgi:hypothetical protein